MKKDRKKVELNAFAPGLLSFAIPVFVVAAAFWSVGIFPGSSLTLLTYDLRFQLLPFYGYLSNGGPGFDSLLYSMSGGLGGGFFGTLALYLSPFDFIYSIIPVKYLADAVYFMVLGKIGLCGSAFCLYLKKSGKVRLSDLFIVILSVSYALMSYNIAYYISPMWYDGVMLLPLLALVAEKVIKGKKSPAFVLLMTFCIISDYYIAYMVALCLTLYIVFRLVEEGRGLRKSVKIFAGFALHGIISAGMSLFVIIPVVLDLRRGKFLEGDFATNGSFVKNSFFDVLSSFMSQRYSGVEYDASPNIFFGTLLLITVLIWLAYGKKEIKARLAAGLIIAFYFLSFILGPLDRMWHGFRDPVCFSCRYAFTFIFFMLVFASRGMDGAANIKINISKSLKTVLIALFALFTFVELYVNASYILSQTGLDLEYTTREEFDHYTDVAENLIPADLLSDPASYGRLFTDYGFTNNDNAMFGYDGFARFSSSYNMNISDMFRHFGVDTFAHTFSNEGITPPVAGLSGAKYCISAGRDLSYIYSPIASYNGYILYENDYALPLAFEASALNVNYAEFTDDPFENINTVYNELISGDDVFYKADYTLTDDVFVSETEGYAYRGIEVRPQKTGHYFLYSEYEAEAEILQSNPDAKQYSYCFDIGLLEGGESYIITLETTGSVAEKVWIYYFDVDAYKTASESVNGFNLSDISRRGIEFKGSVTDDSDLFISLPYESGYKVYVDGKKTEYSSYRDCFLMIPISGGEHIVEMRYFPPGMGVGLLLSLVFATVFVLCTMIHKSNA